MRAVGRLTAAGLLLAGVLATAAPAAALPGVKHVFVIVLENKGFDESFGPGSPAVYMNGTLRPRGKLLLNYYGIGHASLDNYVAMVSGQPPSPLTQGDCPLFADFVGAESPAEPGIWVGQGCVYPAGVRTVADQLEAKGLTWKGYMEDMGNDPARDNGSTCAHPDVGTPDPTETAAANDQYATRHNPFVYFHSVIDRPSCAANDVPLTHLQGDLAQAATTASLSFITPSLCHDGHDTPCSNGEPGGLVSSDQFLQTWVPRILASPAYRDGGMLVVTWDESETNDSSACCNEQPGPNTLSPGIGGPGGGRIGAIVVSPFTQPGTTSTQPYNHYSLLRTEEDLFGLDHLGYAAADGLQPFGTDVFDAPATVQGSPAGAAAPKPDAQSPAVGAAVFGRPLPATGGTSSAMAGLALVLLGLAGLGVARPRLSASGGSRPPA